MTKLCKAWLSSYLSIINLNIHLVLQVVSGCFSVKLGQKSKSWKYIHCLFVFSFRYKFTLDQLYSQMASVTLRAESYKDWLSSVQDILENKESKKRGEKLIQKDLYIHTPSSSWLSQCLLLLLYFQLVF